MTDVDISTLPQVDRQWRQGEVLELHVESLSSSGDGVGRWQGRVVFVPDAVPGDLVRTRLTQVKPGFARGQLRAVLEPSLDRVRPACIVADKCGGCQWQSVAYSAQLTAKQQQVQDALTRIGGFSNISLDPIISAADALGYRNKATYPFGLSREGRVKAGYYRKGSHRLVNLNQCPVQDQRLNPLLAEVKKDIQRRGWSIYNERRHQGHLRHLGLRVGIRTGEMLLTLVSTVDDLPELENQAKAWVAEFEDLVGVCLNQNPRRTNAIFGPHTRLVIGQDYLEERFAELRFRIHPTTFFQVNTEQAERIVQVIQGQLNLKGDETVVDAYCGIGTLTLPLARQARRCIGLEVQPEAIAQARENAALNGLANVDFRLGEVGALLPSLAQELGRPPHVLVLDPPRKGCDRSVLEALMAIHAGQIVYMSCNPATLARDLKSLCGEGGYRLERLQPADFFPQTPHVECVAFLIA